MSIDFAQNKEEEKCGTFSAFQYIFLFNYLFFLLQGKDCTVRLEEKPSGKLHAQCAVDAYPGPSVQTVSDSSRYFVIRAADDSGRINFLGLGFADRSDSFDFNVALQVFFKKK